jgi:hypothetical protein
MGSLFQSKKSTKISIFPAESGINNYFLFIPLYKEIRSTFFYICRLPFSQLAVGNLQ